MTDELGLWDLLFLSGSTWVATWRWEAPPSRKLLGFHAAFLLTFLVAFSFRSAFFSWRLDIYIM